MIVKCSSLGRRFLLIGHDEKQVVFHRNIKEPFSRRREGGRRREREREP